MNLFSALTDYFIRFVYQLSNRRKRPCKLPTFRYEGFSFVKRRMLNGGGGSETVMACIPPNSGTSGLPKD